MMTTYYPPYNFGGDGVFVHRLANELARRGHRVDVVHSLDAYRVAAPFRDRPYDDEPGVTVHALRSRAGRLASLATHQAGRPVFEARSIRQILSRGFDVIHYHNISLVGGPGLLAAGDGVKLQTLHDYWLVCPTHALFRDNRAPCAGPPGCLRCTLVHRRPPQVWRYARMLPRALRHVDAFIAPSLTSQRKHEELGIGGRIVHIPNFVSELPAHPLAARSGVDRRPYFLFVGRLERSKGLDTILASFRGYARADLWIAGTGSEEEVVRSAARGMANVRLLGQTSSAELTALYRDAVALVYPSVNYQVGIPRHRVSGGNGAPLVVMEAFSQRTPVVARDIGSVGAILAESGGGLTYRTEEELLATMDLLLDDPGYRDRIGSCGYEAYRRTWTADAHLGRYLELIAEIEEGRAAAKAASH